MSDYTRQKDFSAKDALTTGDPDKIIKGADVDEEFDAIVTAIATKQDAVSGAITGHVATLSSTGLVQDSGTALADLATDAEVTAEVALKAPLASPTFTGTVTVPTPSASTDAATKQYVDDEVGGVPGGAWELLSSVSASGASSVDMNITDINAGALADDYISFVVFGIGTATGNPNFTFRLKESGSVVNSSSAYYVTSSGETYMQIYDLDRNWAFSFQVLGTRSGRRANVIAGDYESYTTAGGGASKQQQTFGDFTGATRMSTNAADGINFTVSTGTIDGEIRLYGVKNA